MPVCEVRFHVAQKQRALILEAWIVEVGGAGVDVGATGSGRVAADGVGGTA